MKALIARLGVLLNSPVPPARPSDPDPGVWVSDIFCAIAIGGAAMLCDYIVRAT